MIAWERLSRPEHDAVWERFSRRFAFRPSVRPADWPSIAEPSPSLTYDLSGIFGRPLEQLEVLQRDLYRKMVAAFRRAVPPAGKLYALDWQHDCYAFRPHAPRAADGRRAWPVPLLPDGDYCVFLADDLAFGLFGHPWERTLCVFGRELLDAVAADRPTMLRTVVRQRRR